MSDVTENELRALIRTVVDYLQSEDGEPIHVCSEPERLDAPECVRHADGFSFDLRPALPLDVWSDLLTVYEDH